MLMPKRPPFGPRFFRAHVVVVHVRHRQVGFIPDVSEVMVVPSWKKPDVGGRHSPTHTWCRSPCRSMGFPRWCWRRQSAG
jgi:hypothetical protein